MLCFAFILVFNRRINEAGKELQDHEAQFAVTSVIPGLIFKIDLKYLHVMVL